jgi:hypothetical protein
VEFMLDLNFWLDVANCKLDNSAARSDQEFLAKEYAGYWFSSRLNKKLHSNLLDLIDELKLSKVDTAKKFVVEINNACKELGILI